MSLISYGGALCVCHNFYALIFLSLLVLPFDEIQKGGDVFENLFDGA